MTTTGQQIRAARERAGLTQGELAQRVGVTLRTVGNWERGEVSPRNRIARIREVLPDLDGDDRSATLHSASDAELLAEIALRFERTREDEGHVCSAANRQAGESPAYRATEAVTGESASRSPVEATNPAPTRDRRRQGRSE